MPPQAEFRKISAESVRLKTGRSWAEWFAILDQWGMKVKGHTLAAKYLEEHYKLDSWWSQAVTIRYEWERGLRKPAER